MRIPMQVSKSIATNLRIGLNRLVYKTRSCLLFSLNTAITHHSACVTKVRMGNNGLTVSDASANGVGRGNNLIGKAQAFLP